MRSGFALTALELENRRDRRLRVNQSGKRKVVVMIRGHGGETLPGVFNSEGAANLPLLSGYRAFYAVALPA